MMRFTLRAQSLKSLGENAKSFELNLPNNPLICNSADGSFSDLILHRLLLMSCECTKISAKAFTNLTLKSLHLNQNKLPHFPDLTDHEETLTFRQSLFVMKLINNVISNLSKANFQGFDSLEQLNIEYNQIRHLPDDCFENLKSIKSLNFNKNHIHAVQEFALNNPTLRYINLQNNPPLVFSFRGKDLFRHATGIETIYLADCRFEQDTPKYLFQNLTSLKWLKLESVKLSSFGRYGLRGLANLSTLHLDSLLLTELHDETFAGLDSLTELYITANRIRIVNTSSFPGRLSQNIKKLDFSDNPFDCSCELFWFMNWVTDNKHKLMQYGDRTDRYKCSSPESMKNVHLSDLHLSPEECISRPLNVAVWVNLVKNVLLPEFEVHTQPPFKVCMYGRNWLADRNIDECIVESLTQSRKTLMLVTNAFAESQWCQFEIAMAQLRIIENDNDNLLLAVVEDIDYVNMTPRLRLIMKRKVYLRWTEDEVGKGLFWERLKQMLRAESGSLVETMPPREELRSVLS
ncbi:hypothetical protein CAPTEDRAFT_201621 [Capitella teleta]|uniref:Toll-like receptor 4 n=1 Tax=Capitella teleta TaxID=283909 RepID=R7VA14_CAPTE|nr:hypothetical protein CAPTEDRAFT_201621 [Capitella teleta]|eukprot:ELU12575.1 hypothetical protein CAPTEDRAFT_201621 [Capitella teleta]